MPTAVDPGQPSLVSMGCGSIAALALACAAFCAGMALFTVVMGNGFAAFPVIAGGIGIPVLVGVHHADPAVIKAQLPTALPLLGANIVLLYFLMYR